MSTQLTRAQVDLGIDTVIKLNGNEAITGPILNEVLKTITASFLNLITDQKLLGQGDFDPTVKYRAGQTAWKDGKLYASIVNNNTGAWNAANWKLLYDSTVDNVGGIEPYNEETEYSDTEPATYVTHNGNVWEYIGATPSTGIEPGTNDLVWELSSAGVLSHRQNTDIKLAEGTINEVSAAFIKTVFNTLGERNESNGYAGLDSDGLILVGQLQKLINDGLETSTNNTWSIDKINTAIDDAIADLIAASPAALDTLNELAAALGNDPNFATTINAALAARELTANKATSFSVTNNILYPTVQAVVDYFGTWWTGIKSAAQSINGVWSFTSSPTVPTPTNNTDAANKAYIDSSLDSIKYKAVAQNISGSVTINLSTGRVFYLTLTGNVTSFNVSNETPNAQYIFYFIKGTTNYTLTWLQAGSGGKFRFPFKDPIVLTDPTLNGSSPVNSVDIITMFCPATGILDCVRTPDLQLY